MSKITKSAFLKSAIAALALTASVPLASAPAHADARSESNEAYVKGFRLFQAGDYRGARIEFLKALKSNPNNGLARLMQARVALELGSGVAAQTELERAVEAGIPAEKVRHLKAHALLLQGKLSEASDLLDRRTIPPKFAAYAARLRGRIATQQDRPDVAAKEFALAQSLAPKDPDTLVDVARYDASVGKFDEAGKLADSVLAANPTNTKALLVKGDLVRRTKGLEASLPFFNRALEVDPNNIEALLERAATLGDLKRESEARADLKRVMGLVPEHPLALYLEAVLETRAGEYAKARSLMTRTKGMLSGYTPALMLQGMLAYQAGDVSTANSFFAKVVGAVPRSTLARKLYAASQLRANDPKGAIATLKPVIDNKAADGRTYALYGAAFARTGDMEKAQEYLQKAVEQAPKVEGLKTQLAMTQLLQGESEAAEAQLADVLEKDQKSLPALMVLTLVELKDKNYQKALGTANRIIKLYPDQPMGYNIKGGALLGLNKHKEAEAAFRAALKKQPDYIEARRNLAQLLMAGGRDQEAEEELKKVLQVRRDDVRTLTALAALAGKRGASKERVEWLRQAAAAGGNNLAPRAQLAAAYVQAGDKGRALDEASSILRDFPENPAAMMTAARIYEATGRGDRLESTLNRLVTQQPDSVPARVMLARALEANKKVDAARSTYERALAMAGENTTPVYVELIAFEGRQGKLDAAKKWADRLRKAQPKSNAADFALGRAYAAAGKRDEALASLQAARKLKFTGGVARAIADVYAAKGDVKNAIATLQAYQKENPRDPAGLASIAELQLAQKQYKAAIANYHQLMKLGGVIQPIALNNLAWAYSQVGDKRALPTAKKAYAGAAGVPQVADTYGWILLRSKQNPKLALNILKRASAMQPGDAEIRYHLAVAYQVNGDGKNAVASLKEALKTRSFESRQQAQALLGKLTEG